MTTGERMVWAAEFVRMMADQPTDDNRLAVAAANRAAAVVNAARVAGKRAFYESDDLDDDARAMLSYMIGGAP